MCLVGFSMEQCMRPWKPNTPVIFVFIVLKVKSFKCVISPHANAKMQQQLSTKLTTQHMIITQQSQTTVISPSWPALRKVTWTKQHRWYPAVGLVKKWMNETSLIYFNRLKIVKIGQLLFMHFAPHKWQTTSRPRSLAHLVLFYPHFCFYLYDSLATSYLT